MGLLTDTLNKIIEGNAPMTLEEILETEIDAFMKSDKRKAMLEGEAYYLGKQAIAEHQRYTIGRGGERIPIKNLPNAKIVDNQYAIALDKKVNYSFGQAPTLMHDEDQGLEALQEYFGQDFHRTLRKAAYEAMEGGLAYIAPYFDERGEFRFKVLSNHSIVPFFEDDQGHHLEAYCRFYQVEQYIAKRKELVDRVEYCDKDGFKIYERQSKSLKLIEERNHITINGKGYNWDKIPLVPFRYNPLEIPLLSRVKSIQDAINTILSTFQNNMEEDARNTILVLRNYDGTDLGLFREQLAQTGVIKVSDYEGRHGGVDTLNMEVDAENYRAMLHVLKAALVENARSFDAKDERMSGNPNQLNIRSMLLDMEIDANGMEAEFKPALLELAWFALHASNKGKQPKVDLARLDFEFNRDTMINESQVIQDIRASEGLLSRRSLVEQHPWIDDVDQELERMEQEKEAAMDDFFNVRPNPRDEEEDAF